MAWILYDFVASHHSFNPSVAFETSISNVAIEDIPAISVLDATPVCFTNHKRLCACGCKSDSSLVSLATSKIGLIKLRKLIILAKWWRWLFIRITSYHTSFDDHKVLQNSSRQRMAAPRCGLLRLEGVPCAKKIVRTSSSWPCVSPEESTDPLVGFISGMIWYKWIQMGGNIR